MTTPIIDVHTHIFNAADIPLEGYLLSRNSEKRQRLERFYHKNKIEKPQWFMSPMDLMIFKIYKKVKNKNDRIN